MSILRTNQHGVFSHSLYNAPRGDDLFGYARHLDNWLTRPAECDVLFAR
jgi:hypothetical protein